MELLTIRHRDFELSIECTKFDVTWEKAKNNVGEEALQSSYSWSDGVESVVFLKGSDKKMPIEQGVQAKAIFFDNTDYPVWVDFKDYVKDAQFGSILQGDNERFTFHRHAVSAFRLKCSAASSITTSIGKPSLRILNGNTVCCHSTICEEHSTDLLLTRTVRHQK